MSAPQPLHVEGDPLDAVRTACAYVADRAEHVRIDTERLHAYARAIPRDALRAAQPLHFDGLGPTAEERSAFVLALDAINFGSGYWPWLRKRPGLSGYRTVEACLLDVLHARGPLSASALAQTTASECATIFGQELEPPIDELMELFARAWRELGALVQERYAGRFASLVADAGGECRRAIEILLELPLFRDVSLYRGRPIPLLKRAQIAVADLAAVCPPPLDAFRDLDRLTIFSDNLVPHVLRLDGVLRFTPELIARIDAEELLEPGSPEEVEIRACAVHAVERIAARRREQGRPCAPHALDRWLWTRGGRPEYKAHRRHRAQSWFY